MYGEFVAEDPVTVTEHVELLPEALVSVQVGVGLKVTLAAEELNVHRYTISRSRKAT